MKTTINSTSTTANALKQVLYALQVIIIALAIPVLSYIELSHVESKDQPSAEKNATKVVSAKTGTIAYNEITK